MQSIITKQDLGCGFSGQFDEAGKGYMRAPDGERYAQQKWTFPLLGCEADCCLNIRVAEYRAKCAHLVLFTFPKGAIVLLYRLIDFTLLGSVRRGWEYGNRSLRQVKFKSDHNLSKIHYFALKRVCIYAYHCSACLISDMLKIATFPICLILIQIFSIFGLIFPHHARFLISKLQILWEYDNLLHREALANGHSPRWIHSCFLFSVASGFESIEYFNKCNLYMYLEDFHPEETRSLWLRLFHTFRDNRALFTEDEYNKFISCLQKIKDDIRLLSPHSRNEVTEINGVVALNNAPLDDLIAEISKELGTFKEDERDDDKQLFQALQDTLKNASSCQDKMNAIGRFHNNMKRELGNDLKNQINKTWRSLAREQMRESIESTQQCLNQYIDGGTTLEDLQKCFPRQ